MTTDRVMLLIDADNVSLDVIEQAVALLLQTHGALHVRRAYCTAESAVKHQAAFKRLGIKPMVNLATGKNSTDIALAVDALDLVLAERPDVVAIASSDSDFAPLVARLREKGCRVVGLGQEGKTGDETQAVYDEFTVIKHHKSAATPLKAVRKTAPVLQTTGPAGLAADHLDDPQSDSHAALLAGLRAHKQAVKAAVGSESARIPVSAKAGKVKTAAKKTPAARTAKAKPAPAKAAPVAAAVANHLADPKVQAILACLPELQRGDTLELRVASTRLREAGLLSRSGSTPKLLGPFASVFELLPSGRGNGQPNHLRLVAVR
jgi:uncharacterized protein (TIGR00288 family)